MDSSENPWGLLCDSVTVTSPDVGRKEFTLRFERQFCHSEHELSETGKQEQWSCSHGEEKWPLSLCKVGTHGLPEPFID